MKIYKIFRLSLLLFVASVVSCQKDNSDFELSSQATDDAIQSIYDNMIGVSESGGYSIGRYEVTQVQWQAVMGYNPSRVKGDNRPVESVTEEEICYFLNKLNEVSNLTAIYSLPTASQWYAAAGAIPEDLGTYAWYLENSGGTPHEVGKKSPNANGFYDMYGNVAEFVADGIRSNNIRLDDPKARGGSWNASVEECSTSEDTDTQSGYTWEDGNFTYRIPTLGLRLLIDEYIEPQLEPEQEEQMAYSNLSDFSSTTFPTDTDIWTINDSSAEATDFYGLNSALIAAEESSRKISLIFPYLETIPKYSLIGRDIANFTDYRSNALFSVTANVATSIEDYAIFNFDGLEQINFPKAITVGKYAFYHCDALKTVVLSSVETINSEAFRDCVSLTFVSLATEPSVTLKYLDNYTFLNVDTYNNVTLYLGEANASLVTNSMLKVGNTYEFFKDIVFLDENGEVVDTDSDTIVGDAPDMEYETLF